MCLRDIRSRFEPLFAPSMSISPSKSRSESLSSSFLNLVSKEFEGGGVGGNIVMGIVEVRSRLQICGSEWTTDGELRLKIWCRLVLIEVQTQF
jgi:hypothetical protein